MSSDTKIRGILRRLDEQQRSMAWLGKAIGASRQSVQQWLTEGANPRNPDIYDTMFDVLQMANLRDSIVQDTLSETEPGGQQKLKYAGVVPRFEGWINPFEARETTELGLKFLGHNRFATKVVGDSGYDALLPGDLAVWQGDTDPTYGLIVLAQNLNASRCAIKLIEYDKITAKPSLSPVNSGQASSPEEETWTVIARLVGIVRNTDGLKKSWLLESGLRPRHLQEHSPATTTK